MRLVLVASKPTDAVTFGFLPAAEKLGLDVTLLTDLTQAHRPAGIRVIGCDVHDSRALIRQISVLPAPDAIFSNSDRLQTQTALAAQYFGVPGKDWRSCLRANDKLLMRRRLAQTGIEQVAAAGITTSSPLPPDLAFPLVVKPADGVASEDVLLADGPEDLARHCADYFRRKPDGRLMAEEYLPGTLRTLETIGDGRTTWVLGGFRTTVSAPPVFIEERLTWDPLPPGPEIGHVRTALDDLGVSFGACHTEFSCDPEHGTRLVEVNDRLIGDHCDFLLSGLAGVDLFELVLRVHLGEQLPADPPSLMLGYAIADYVCAERAGLLGLAPCSGPLEGAEPGVTLEYWPFRQPGDQVEVTGSNRDYLGVITAFGNGQEAVQRSVTAARERGQWRIEQVVSCP